jgi:transposase
VLVKRIVTSVCTRSTQRRYHGVPELLDDYVSENNPVRVVDAFVDKLDLGEPSY